MSSAAQIDSLESPGVLIIGGGVIGLTIARALKKRGQPSVTVIEQDGFGREASWAAGGILAPQVEASGDDEFFRLACASRDMYPEFAEALAKESGIDVELETTGTMYVAFSEAEETEFRARFEWQHSRGLSVEWLTSAEINLREPEVSETVRCALRFPNDYQVENRRLVKALLRANEKLGVRLIGDCEAQRVRIENGRATGVETSQGFIPASSIVVAAGAWSTSLLPASTSQVEIEPVRGQMLSFQPPRAFAHHVIYSSRGYLIPRRDGRLLAGSTTERVGFDKRVTETGISTIKSMAYEIAPALEALQVVDSWAGFRPRAKDGLPVLGRTKDVAGLLYATGHYRNGILLAPITGELIAESIVSPARQLSLSAFSPDRFGLNR